MTQFGPRHEKLLDAWATTIETNGRGNGFDFTSPTRTNVLEQKVEAFLDSPSEDEFRDVWQSELIRGAAFGGSNAVLNNWNLPIDALAEFIREIRDATSYDPSWERQIPEYVIPAVREFYGRCDPETRPILSSATQRGLSTFGFGTVESFSDAAGALRNFQERYCEQIGHMTVGTEHEVALSDEIEQFLHLVSTSDEAELRKTLDMAVPMYETFAGWDALQTHGNPIELHGLSTVLDSFSAASNSAAYERDTPLEQWGDNHWETWKDEYCAYVSGEVLSKYDLTELQAADVEPFLDDLSVAEPLSDVIPIYLLGGRWQPWDTFQQLSTTKSDKAATVLSNLLNEDAGPLMDRLESFNDLYSELSDSGSERMSVATMLLMIVHPDQYVMYRYQMFDDFFSEFSDYSVPYGFNPGDYILMLDALRGVQADLDTTTDHDIRMLDVHSLLWLVHREGPP